MSPPRSHPIPQENKAAKVALIGFVGGGMKLNATMLGGPKTSVSDKPILYHPIPGESGPHAFEGKKSNGLRLELVGL